MLRVLWLSNIIIPKIARALGRTEPVGGGWITAMAEELKAQSEIALGICFFAGPGSSAVTGEIDGLRYFGYTKEIIEPWKYDLSVEKQFGEIIKEFKPDVVHIFGTEFPHSLSMVRAFGKPGRTIVSIQGLVSVIAKHYCQGLPTYVQRKYTLRDVIRHDNIIQQKKKLEKRGRFEIEVIKMVSHIVGRTDWDEACIMQINPNAKYHYNGEILRDVFYQKRWKLGACRRYSIFISQADYPVKGFHHFLEGLEIIVKRYPLVHVYVAGGLNLENQSLQKKIRISYYEKYLEELIAKHRLNANITYLGYLDAIEMSDYLLKSHVFVSASTIENSPNSLGEALLLGVPSVASDVGGVKNLLVHDKEGYVYQQDAPYMLAYYVMKIFEEDRKTMEMSNAAQEHARKIYDKEKIVFDLLKIYNEVGGEQYE